MPSRQRFNVDYTYSDRPPLRLAANRSCTGGSEFAKLRPERLTGVMKHRAGEMARQDMRVQGPLNSNSNSNSTRRDREGEFEVERDRRSEVRSHRSKEIGNRNEERGKRNEKRGKREGRKRRRLRSAARVDRRPTYYPVKDGFT